MLSGEGRVRLPAPLQRALGSDHRSPAISARRLARRLALRGAYALQSLLRFGPVYV
jgi:hypothetical protein